MGRCILSAHGARHDVLRELERDSLERLECPVVDVGALDIAATGPRDGDGGLALDVLVLLLDCITSSQNSIHYHFYLVHGIQKA